jgi:menaquinone-dependent protoporphyrinogen oxidase
MPRILVLYGTTDGHTAKIAHAIGETLRGTGADVDIIDARRGMPHPDVYGGIVVAASVHAGGYQRAVRRWVRRHAHDLEGRPTAFVSVCLGILQREPKVQREVAATVDRFLTRTAWHPTVTKSVAGALLYTHYNRITRLIMRRIARSAGGDTDTSRDYEYTDWADLRTFAEQFGGLVRARATSEATTASGHGVTRVA